MKERGDLVTLQIIGDGPERQNLELLVKKLNVSDNVMFHGEIESDTEAYSWMKASRLFVHPSTKEGGGSITVLEANACGLPVVAYKDENGIADELIEEGNNGYWIEKPNAKVMADRIHQLLRAENLDLNIKDNSIGYARRYDWSKIASEYNAYFLRVLDDEKGKKAV